MLHIYLSSKDKDHLILFQKCLETDAPIQDITVKNKPGPNNSLKKNEYFMSLINICSKEIVLSLQQYNIVDHKTFTYTLPNVIRTNENLRHFIRGCLDGDGCFSIRNNIKKRHPRIGFCGNNTFCRQIFELLKSECGLPNDSGRLVEYPTYSVFEFDTHREIVKIINYIYDGAETFLLRKSRKAQIMREYITKHAKGCMLKFITKEELQSLYDRLETLQNLEKYLKSDARTIKRVMQEFGIQQKICKDR